MLEAEHCRAFCTLWMIQVLARVKSFGMRVFLNRSTTKDQLIKKRGMCLSKNDGTCIFCLQLDEYLNHIHFECLVSMKVWWILRKLGLICHIVVGHLGDSMGTWFDWSISFVGHSWKHFLTWYMSTDMSGVLK